MSDFPGRKKSLLTMLETGQVSLAVRLLLESLQAPDIERWCLVRNLSFEEIAPLQSSFLSGGTQRILSMQPSPRWYQANVGLNQEQWTQWIAGDFQDRLRAWLSAGPGRIFFFVNKNPGIRLRMIASSDSEIEEITRLLDEMSANQKILFWSRGVYEPEIFQFGGELGLGLAHEYFCADSLVVMDFQRICAANQNSVRPEQFSVLLLDALLRSAMEDESEVWEVWCRMELTGRLDRSTIEKYSGPRELFPGQAPRRLREQLRAIHYGKKHVAEPEHRLLENYKLKVAEIGKRLRELGQAGGLLWGTRQILPFWIIFHWNRMRFSFDVQRRLATYMVKLYSPKISS